jgi:hypothetical protein
VLTRLFWGGQILALWWKKKKMEFFLGRFHISSVIFKNKKYYKNETNPKLSKLQN